jgi:beta-galactosidase
VGNGDPAWQAQEQPSVRNARTFRVRSFNGLAQVILQTTREAGTATFTCTAGKAVGKVQFTLNN